MKLPVSDSQHRLQEIVGVLKKHNIRIVIICIISFLTGFLCFTVTASFETCNIGSHFIYAIQFII